MDSSGPIGPIITDFNFTPSDRELACQEIRATSAPGPDGIPASLLKECSKELKTPIWVLWQESMNQGVIPPDWLLVLISPVHKG